MNFPRGMLQSFQVGGATGCNKRLDDCRHPPDGYYQNDDDSKQEPFEDYSKSHDHQRDRQHDYIGLSISGPTISDSVCICGPNASPTTLPHSSEESSPSTLLCFVDKVIDKVVDKGMIPFITTHTKEATPDCRTIRGHGMLISSSVLLEPFIDEPLSSPLAQLLVSTRKQKKNRPGHSTTATSTVGAVKNKYHCWSHLLFSVILCIALFSSASAAQFQFNDILRNVSTELLVTSNEGKTFVKQNNNAVKEEKYQSNGEFHQSLSSASEVSTNEEHFTHRDGGDTAFTVKKERKYSITAQIFKKSEERSLQTLKFIHEKPTRKLGECEGDCDSDSECLYPLRCLQREEGAPVPGCKGTPYGAYDYCVNPKWSRPTLHGDDPNPTQLLGQCEGDCDSDSDCNDGRYCFQRDGVTPVPGCNGSGKPNFDYCTYGDEPIVNSISTSPTQKLRECEGDCDDNSNCVSPLVCRQRETGDPVPGCKGNPKLQYDYCMKPDWLQNADPKTLHHDPTTLHPTHLLGQCGGDCDRDSDCEYPLVCHQRGSGGPSVPGCKGTPYLEYDYCVHPVYKSNVIHCPSTDIPPSTYATPGIIKYDQPSFSIEGLYYPAGTKAAFQCPYNPLWTYSNKATCQSLTADWDKDPGDECAAVQNNAYDGDFRLLPGSFNSCPSFMFLGKKDCRRAGLSLGGTLYNGDIVEEARSDMPFRCSIGYNGIIHYNSVQGNNNGDFQPVCSRGSLTLLPKTFAGGCLSLFDIHKEDCAAAGLASGGRLRDGYLVEGSWGEEIPFGCSIQSGGDIYYNSNSNAVNGGIYASLCHELPFVMMHGLPICPLQSSVSKEECIVAGLSVGGTLENNEIVEGEWSDRPIGCFLTKDNNIVHFNKKSQGATGENYVLVCNEIEAEDYIVIPPKLDLRCPSSVAVTKDQCADAGSAVGGTLQENGGIIGGPWDDKPTGCFFTPDIHYNTKDYKLHFQTDSELYSESNGDFEIVGYGLLDKSCHNARGAGCDIALPYNMERLVMKAHTNDGWKFSITGDIGNILDYKTVSGGAHFPPFPTWMDKDEFDTQQTYDLRDNLPEGDWHHVCNKLKGVTEVIHHANKCPPGKEVNKEDCIAAGLTAGAKPIRGLFIDGSWTNRPSGCFMETFGNKLVYYNSNANPTDNGRNNDVKLLCQRECLQPNTKQHPKTLGCQCADGYLSGSTGQKVLEGDDDFCISALNSTFIDTTTSTITYSSIIITEMKNLTLSQSASPNDIKIQTSGRFSTNSTTNTTSGVTKYSYTFSDLDPGHRYNAEFTYTSPDGETFNMIFPAVTSCSACGSGADKTGPPTNFEVFQDNGHVMFSFEDCSVCEEAYSFTRTSYEEGNNVAVSFTRDYFFIPKQAYGAKINPLTEASDNLAKSKLIVGHDYKYCVRAVHPILYMDHPYDHEDTGRTLLSSSDTCADHRIQWEASVHGRVTTEPNAGSLPIKDVHIKYSLLREDGVTPMDCDGCSGSSETTEGGAFDITFNVDHETLYYKNTHEIPVKITFSKSTTGNNNTIIEHQFLCNEGEDDCSGDIGTVIYLSHLQFREPIHIYDDTSVPFSGQISIADTSYPGAPEGCALANAEVCLIHKRKTGGVMKIDETLVCGFTGFDGTYSVPVIIGSRVDYIDVMYHNHTFEPSLDSDFEPGTVIEAEKYYHNMNFEDITKARLMVDVVGGLCDKNLGTSSVQVKIVGCDWNEKRADGTWDTEPKVQPGTRGIYNSVPAHLLEVQVLDVKDTEGETIQHIKDFFQSDRPLVRTIDLRSTGAADTALAGEEESLSGNSTTGIKSKDDIKRNEKKNLEAMEHEEEEDLELVRFQFDGNLKMEVSVFPNSAQCSNYSSTSGDSFHVLEYMKYFSVRVDLKYEIIKDKVYCDIVDSELKLRVENNVGVDNNSGFDDFFNSISDDKTQEAMKKCSGDGCLYDIGHEEDEEGNPVSGANVTDWFATGRPNIVSPFTKTMKFTIQGGTGDIKHTADFLIEGYYSKGPGRSFALPTHKPIMILRDPPGGLSYATYENVMTTIKLETSSKSTSVHNKFGFDIKSTVDTESNFCAGGGFGALAIFCTDVAEVINKARVVGLDQTTGGIVQKTDETRSNQFSTTWSYRTSSDPWTAGSMSDVFVVPNLNVMYREVYVVERDNATCAVITQDDGSLPITTTFNIKDPENEPALAFFSRYHVNKVKIPELQAAKENKESQKDRCGCTDDDPEKTCTYKNEKDEEETTTCSEIENEIRSLLAGISGWNTALQVEKDSFDSLTSDATKSINNWFSDFGVKNMHEAEAVHISDQASGLEPPSLPEESLENEFADDIENKPLKRIQFSGGGNTLSMTMNKEKVWDEVGLSDFGGKNFESETSIKGPGIDEITFFIGSHGPEMQFLPLDFDIHVLHESTKEMSQTESTLIGFVLGDNDPQDEFVVDLYYDNKYGTIIFKTVAGQSKCPHEPNTAAVEDPSLIISKRPSQYIFPDEDMVFEVEMRNLGVGDESLFNLYVQHRDNDGGLKLILDGAPFGGSREFPNIGRNTAYKKTLVVQRGPGAYEFDSLDLAFESACEDGDSIMNDLTASVFAETKSVSQKLYNVQGDEDTYLIKFVEPCPKVEWAGDLNRDRHFVVNTNSEETGNIEVIIFNPNHGRGKFYNLTSDRLQNVFLYYREVGDLHWSKGRTEIKDENGNADSKEIDFAAEYAYKGESDYGYSNLKWALANKVPEGTYEIRVTTECDQLGGPADMDVYSTPILSGIIDLTPPEQYGRALPLRESVLVGEEMAVVFTEPVRCETFDLLVVVDNIGVELDRNDPPIQIVCDGRKVGFQIDPTQINVEDWIGMSFTVEMGKISTANVESKSNIFDMNGNPIKDNVEFQKKFADIDLSQASTKFTVTLKSMSHCSDVSSSLCAGEIQDKIASLLNLSLDDKNRIEVKSVSADPYDASTMKARVKILPTKEGTTRMLRRGKSINGDPSDSDHSVGLFRQLQHTVQDKLEGQESSDVRMLDIVDDEPSNLDAITVVSVSEMKILPGNSDMYLVTTDPEMVQEEKELHRHASLKGNVGMNVLSQPVMNNIERQALVDELKKEGKEMVDEMKRESNSREEIMMTEMKSMSDLLREFKENKEKSDLKALRFELTAVTVACLGISLVVFFSLRRH